MRPILLAISAFLMLSADGALGQMVRTYPGGGVSVRAPFVRVNVGPNGQTSVRAPFVNLNTLGRPPCYQTAPVPLQPLTPAPALVPAPALAPAEAPLPAAVAGADKSEPTPADPALLDWQALRRMLRSGTAMLNDRLDELETGAGWKDYLQTGPLSGLVGDDVNQPPSPAALDTMRSALARYDATSHVAEFQTIAALRGFGMVHAALREFTTRPVTSPSPPPQAAPLPTSGPREF